ncbi:MAG: conjugal transfer protein TraN [Thermodesulfobacteriota bacterium]
MLFETLINCNLLKRLIVSIIVFTLVLTPTLAFSGSFEEALQQGKDLGTQDILNFNPQNIDQTLEQKGLGPVNEITPKAGEAQGKQGSYSGYYTNPGGMSGAESSQAGQFVEDSYVERPKFDLSQDSLFGNQCLRRDDDGRCLMWSTSRDLITNTYPDCEKVVIPRYGETYEKTCNETETLNRYDCEVRSYIEIGNEEVQGPCSQVSVDVRPDQVYGVCRDYRVWYKVLKGVLRADVDHCKECDEALCGQIGGCTWYGSGPYGYIVQSESGLPAGAQFQGKSLENLSCTGKSGDRHCGGTYYDNYIFNKSSVIERIYLRKDSTCVDNLDRWLEECSVETYAQCGSGCLYCVSTIENGEETGQNLDPSYKCQSFSGSIENYDPICLKGEGTSLNSRSLTTTPIREESTTQENGLTITWARLYGGSGVRSGLNDWCSRITFACGSREDSCQALRDQGCYFYSERCLDSDCSEIKYTYRCGQGGITGYTVAYNCAGELRCLGTDCVDASYEANTDFASAATVVEVLNQYRADSSGTLIFPGEKQECQSSPRNCCRKAGGGVSIGDYINAARATISLYSYISGGTSATWINWANTFTYILSSGEYGSLSGLFGTTISDLLGTTTQTLWVENSLAGSFELMGFDYTVEGGMTLVSFDTAIVSTLATVATVVTVALVVYSIGKFLYDWYFQCKKDDILTSSRLNFHLCHYIGSRCSKKILGICIKRNKVYCCFNSILARLIHEQGRPQIGIGWGSTSAPNCRGLTPEELASIDFSRVDLREYMQYVLHKMEISPEKSQSIIDRIRHGYNY